MFFATIIAFPRLKVPYRTYIDRSILKYNK
jgi:hypothetical protein